MQEQDGSKFDIGERLESLLRRHEALLWEGTFRDYFELVTQNPRLAELSHARINDMVHAAGVEKLNEGTRDEVTRYNFFASELFGIEEPVERIVLLHVPAFELKIDHRPVKREPGVKHRVHQP